MKGSMEADGTRTITINLGEAASSALISSMTCFLAAVSNRNLEEMAETSTMILVAIGKEISRINQGEGKDYK